MQHNERTDPTSPSCLTGLDFDLASSSSSSSASTATTKKKGMDKSETVADFELLVKIINIEIDTAENQESMKE